MVADVFAPIGRLEKDGEGYRLYGQWNFASGVLWSEYIGLGAMADLGNGPEYVMAVVRTTDPNFKLIENWDTLGLRSYRKYWRSGGWCLYTGTSYITW